MTFNIGKPKKGNTQTESIENLYQYLNRLADDLKYALNNMDAQNLTAAFAQSLQQGGNAAAAPGMQAGKVKQLAGAELLKGMQSCVLYQGTAGNGSTISLNDRITNYRLVVVRFADSLFEAVCPVTSGNKNGTTNAVRGSSSFVTDASVYIRSVTMTYDDATPNRITLTTTNTVGFSGSAFKITATQITRIVGVK